MNAILALLVLQAVLISLLVRLMMSSPRAAKSFALPCQHGQTC